MKVFTSLFCAICGENDSDDNLHAAGSLHATKSDCNITHNNELTEKWKEMAAKVGNTSLLCFLSQGDLAANETYYHHVREYDEQFVLEMYSIRKVNNLMRARLDSFKMSTDNDIRKLPPSKGALTQHTKRACYVSSWIFVERIGKQHTAS